MPRARVPLSRIVPSCLLACSAAGLAAGAQAQGTSSRVADEGLFRLVRDGAPVGREAFRIAWTSRATAPGYAITADVVIGSERSSLSAETDSAGAPLLYRFECREAGALALRVRARARANRLSAVTQTPRGEGAREYVLPERPVVVDDGLAHQLYFVILGRTAGPVAYVIPRRGLQGIATLEPQGTEPIEIGGVTVPSRHFTLAGGGLARRDFWVDASGRLLRVSIPDDKLVATREEAPR